MCVGCTHGHVCACVSLSSNTSHFSLSQDLSVAWNLPSRIGWLAGAPCLSSGSPNQGYKDVTIMPRCFFGFVFFKWILEITLRFPC